ncbi:MAG TPA: hypothetical protein VHX88_01005 [Solirubrobacteraceae bacterium]|jgi:hypothetical protein|nr:hypothetical protein [Solirubrobacteraceae bacterium]
MGAALTRTHDEGDQPSAGGAIAEDAPVEDRPVGPSLSAAGGDLCRACGASLASDQRYCVTCGERRGTSRFGTDELMSAGAPSPPVSPEPPPRRGSSGATVLAGLATLVLALGVGVEIGHVATKSNAGPDQRATAQPVTVVVPGGEGATTAATTTPATVATSAPPPKAASAKATARVASKTTPTVKAAASAKKAASSVLGTSGAGQQNNTVTTGQSCASGSSGCQGGKFTGSFFGG